MDKEIMREEVVERQDEAKVRASKWERILAAGHPRYPNHFTPTASLDQLYRESEALEDEALVALNRHHRLTGRIIAIRRMGKLIFIKIRDGSGTLQIAWSASEVGEACFKFWSSVWDLGDLVGFEGVLGRMKRGTLTLRANQTIMLAKSLSPPPEKFHGLMDPEICQRKRYLDLMANEETFKRFETRALLVQWVREYLFKENFLEFETPMMQSIPGGATARPFITHHHALKSDFYLRISPELYLKRLLVGGFDRIFELNRSFRNEGLSSKHNPEFTMVEFYEAYAQAGDHMDRVEHLMRHLATRLHGSPRLPDGMDLSKPFRRCSFEQLLVEELGGACEGQTPHQRPDLWRYLAESHGLMAPLSEAIEVTAWRLFEHLIEPRLQAPIFVTDHPATLSPLARRQDGDPTKADRFELFVQGMEIANGFSELNDPEIQHENFKKQVEARDAGDDEAMFYDADYVEALQVGMPPAAGTGIGIDRLVMWLTGAKSIREVILFPALRPLPSIALRQPTEESNPCHPPKH